MERQRNQNELFELSNYLPQDSFIGIRNNVPASVKNVHEWINNEIDFGKENEESLQEKIISLYDAIEEKTIKNIQVKKSNQIIKAQVEAYTSIIQKIKKTMLKEMDQAKVEENNQKYGEGKNLNAGNIFKQRNGDEGECNLHNERRTQKVKETRNMQIIKKLKIGEVTQFLSLRRNKVQKDKGEQNGKYNLQPEDKLKLNFTSPRHSLKDVGYRTPVNNSFLKKGDIQTGNGYITPQNADINIETLWDRAKSPRIYEKKRDQLSKEIITLKMSQKEQKKFYL